VDGQDVRQILESTKVKEQIKEAAETFTGIARELTGMQIGFTPDSVKWLDGYIEKQRAEGAFADEDDLRMLANMYGAFYGQCIIQCYGGDWQERDGRWAVAFDDRNAVFPLTKVAKQIQNGPEDSIYGMFDMISLTIPGKVSVPPPLPNSVPPPLPQFGPPPLPKCE
jgi:hypothetical protein